MDQTIMGKLRFLQNKFRTRILFALLFISCADFESQNCQDTLDRISSERILYARCFEDSKNETDYNNCLLAYYYQNEQWNDVIKYCQSFTARNPEASPKRWKL